MEHVSSIQALESKLNEMILGTKINGINCIIINSNVRENLTESDIDLEPLIEVNLTTESMFRLLDQQYEGWEIQMRIVKQLEFPIDRSGKSVKLMTDCITFVAKNKMGIIGKEK